MLTVFISEAVDKLNRAKTQGRKNTLCWDSTSHRQQDFDAAVQRPVVNFTTLPPTRKAGTRTQHSKHAADIYEFFTYEGGYYRCNYCLRKREESAIPEAINVHPYSPDTGNTNMQRHLVAAHFHEWIDDCDARGIPVTADCTIEKAKLYQDQHNHPDPTVALKFAAFSREGLQSQQKELQFLIGKEFPICPGDTL
ncbi:hypothetical protein VNI00_000080 [Paramarasmius palmivorus]|uniref:BED-type domain-containing protein n=1 Tax=Paramarasmius palmivorus TaxID=297713 RepID=A0AAW0EEA0_9AGAR